MAAFELGDIVVYRVGNGTTALSSAAAQVFLDEYSPTGQLVQSIALPTVDIGAAHALTASGSATSEGLITDSADGSTLLLAGYDAAPGTASIASSTAAADPRIVGRVSGDGTVDTGTVLTGFDSGNNIRGAASSDGNAIYASGATGVGYTTAGSTATPSALSTTNTRQIENVGGQLYYSTGSTTSAGPAGIYTLGTGTPTTPGQTGTLLPGTGAGTGSNGSSPYAFAFADLSPTIAGNDTLYVADSDKGIEKFSLVDGTWVSNGQIAFSGVTGLVASVANGNVTLYATSPSSIDKLVDTNGYNAALPPPADLTNLVTAPSNTAFRGVAFAPAGSTTPPPPGATVSIGDATYVQGSGGGMSLQFTVTRSDTSGAFSLQYGTTNGSAIAGRDYEATTGMLSFAAGGPATATIAVPIDNNPSAPPSENFNVNLSNIVSTSGSATFSKASATGTIVTPTPIYNLQGSTGLTPFAGQAVTTEGIVTAVGSTGYYLQDAKGDGNAATSDGIFVFTGSTPTNVNVGDSLDVSGTVQEYKPASADPGAFTSTEIGNVSSTTTISQHNSLPDAVMIGPDGRLPPTDGLAAGNAFYESLEGMRVTVENPVAVGPTNQYGEIFTVADGGKGDGLNGSGNLLIKLGDPSFGDTDTVGGDFNPERIKIDSELLAGAVPSVNTGTQFGNATGILNYDFNNFGVSATTPLTVTKPSPITPTIGTLTGDANHLTVASYNIENFSLVDQHQAKVDAVANQIVTNLKSPDIIALQEVQDNSGTANNGVTSGSQNLQALVDAVNKAGGPQYAYIDNPFIGNNTNGGEPYGNIRNAFLYRTDRVGFTPGSLATVAANGSAITEQGSASADAAADADQQTDVQNPFYDSRPPLSAQFTFNGQTVTIVNNHFTSKGGSGALEGSQQPPFDGGEVQRAAQAQAVNTYVNGILSGNANAKVVVTGDLNEFNGEEPLRVLEGTATISGYHVAGTDPIGATATYTPNTNAPILTDLETTLPADQQYDYNFEGNSESLVHVLASNSLAASAQIQPLHINADYADGVSDHDPLLTSYAIAPVCFAQGTRIATARGDVPVEALCVGDEVVTSAGTLRPIRWLGHRSVDCKRHPRRREVLPVRIAAHAFGERRPARDLVVSPAHSICVDVVGETLIPAVALVDGTTIAQVDVDAVTYWHVELDSHDILLAENLGCESYLDMGNRRFFAEADVVDLAAGPDGDAAARTHADFCRPYREDGKLVEIAREQLRKRAAIRAVPAAHRSGAA